MASKLGGGGEEESTRKSMRRRRRRRRRLFRDVLCALRGPEMPTPNRDDVVLRRGCLPTACDPSAAGVCPQT